MAAIPMSYVVATMTYGALSKLHSVHNATVQRDFTKGDDDAKIGYRQVPMLLRDKVFLTGLAAYTSVYLWPIYVYCDLGKIELIARGEYKKPAYAHWLDYILPC